MGNSQRARRVNAPMDRRGFLRSTASVLPFASATGGVLLAGARDRPSGPGKGGATPL